MRARALLTSALFVVATLLSSARVRADVIRVPSNAGTINIAFALSAPYDTILVAPGTYKVNLEWPHKQGLKLLSEAGPTQTVLDGSADVQVIGIYTGVDTTTVISGFTIRNGHAEGQWPWCSGGGVRCLNSSPLFTEIVFTENTAGNHGAGLHCENGDVVVRDCDFVENTGGSGAGAWIEGDSHARLVRCRFEGNTAAGIGGGVATDGAADVLIRNCEFVDNVGGSGGAVYVSVGTATIDDCTLTGNDAEFGGGLCFVSAASVTVRRTRVEWSDASYQGGGLYASDSSFDMEDCNVSDCRATLQGGAAWMLTSTTSFSRCAFLGNWSGGLGGGFYVDGTGVTANACEFVGNGVAIHLQSGGRAPADARWCWWGDSSGPHNALANPLGTGDEVSNGVNFGSWLVVSSSEELPDVVESTWGAIKSLYR